MRSRRAFLKIGGATIAAGGLALGWHAHERGVFTAGAGPAYDPWGQWRGESLPGVLALVAAGILASSPHNTQPWLFEVQGDRIILRADLRRSLGAMDPVHREMIIGLGCAVENMRLAARARGFDLHHRSGGGAGDFAVQLDLARGEPLSQHQLYEAIPHRHTNRGPFDPDRPLPPEEEGWLKGGREGDSARLIMLTGLNERQALADATVAATEAIIGDAEMAAHGHRWTRWSPADIARHRDGLTIDAWGLPAATGALLKMMPEPDGAELDRGWLDATRDVQVKAPAFGLIVNRDPYDRDQQLQAGMLWQRLHLRATTRGLAMQPLNQAVERIDRDRHLGKGEGPFAAPLARLVGDRDWRVTFIFRVGWPERPALASPRRALAAMLAGTNATGDRV